MIAKSQRCLLSFGLEVDPLSLSNEEHGLMKVGIKGASILVVDDVPQNLRLLTQHLQCKEYCVRVAPNGAFALRAIEQELPDLILLDILMPGLDGYEVCSRLQKNELTRDIPVIFLSALSEPVDRIRAFEVGAVDCVTKPFHMVELERRIATHLELRRAKLELQESYRKLSRLEVHRQQMVQMLVHDIRSPLTMIWGQLDLLYDELQETIAPECLADIHDAKTAASRVGDMISNMLDIRRIESDQMSLTWSTCSIGEFIEQAIAVAHGVEKDRQIWADYPEGLNVRCDKQIIQRVFENLLVNAIKHTLKGTDVGIRAILSGDRVKIEVCDRGVGVPEKNVDKIFEQFNTVTVREGGGFRSSGLGLAFCKLAIDAHDEEIGLETSEGVGATFWFSLRQAVAISELDLKENPMN